MINISHIFSKLKGESWSRSFYFVFSLSIFLFYTFVFGIRGFYIFKSCLRKKTFIVVVALGLGLGLVVLEGDEPSKIIMFVCRY